MTIRRLAQAGVLAALVAASTVFAADDKDKKPDVVINIKGQGKNAKYIREGDAEQKPVTVTVGQTVRWTNMSDATHTATEGQPGNKSPRFDTADIRINESKDVVFDEKLYKDAGGKPGGEITLKYHCARHPNTMKDAEIVLKSVGPKKD